jgi:hypothetical protein
MVIKTKEKNSATSVWVSCFIVFTALFLLHCFRRFGNPLDEMFLLITNKSLAFTSFFMLSFAYLVKSFAVLWPKKWEKRLPLIREYRILGLSLDVGHILLSLAMLSAAYYPEYFAANGKFTGKLVLSLLSGTVATAVYLALTLKAGKEGVRSSVLSKVALVAYAMTFLHFFVLKMGRVFASSSWSNGLPPGSLVGFSITVLVIIFAVWAALKQKKT